MSAREILRASLLIAGLAAAGTAEGQGAPPPTGDAVSPAERIEGFADSVRLEAELDSTGITVGSLAHLTVRVHHPVEVTVGAVFLPGDLGDLVVRDARELPLQKGEHGQDISTTVYEITAYAPGQVEIPAPEVEFIRSDGTKGKSVGPPTALQVRSVLPASADSLRLRDIKDLARVPGPGFPLREALIGLGAAALLAGGIWFFRRRRRRAMAQALPGPPPLPPAVVARRALEALRAKNLPVQGLLDPFYVELTAIARRYLAGRYEILALDMTTTEITENLAMRLSAGSISPEAFVLARELLDAADLVKFARGRPPQEVANAALNDAYRLVDLTEPPPAQTTEELQPAVAGSGGGRADPPDRGPGVGGIASRKEP